MDVKPAVPRPVGKHIWRHAIETGLCAGLCAYAAVTLTPVPTPVLAALTVVAGLIITASVVASTAFTGMGWYFTTWTAVLAGWVTWTRMTTPWSWPAFGILAGAVIILTPAGAHLYSVYADEQRKAAEAEERRKAAAALGTWNKVFADLGLDGVTATAVRETRAGRIVTLRLPRNGRVSSSQLRSAAENIAIARRLPADSVSFEQGGHAGEWLMHLNEVDILAVDAPFPELGEFEYLTVNRPFPVAVREDGEPCEILYREVAALVVGLRGSGKTNLLNVLIAQLTACVDTIVFVIDMKGGRLAAPWVLPWLRGECDNPPVDWVATNRDEAEAMLRSVAALVDARGAAFQGGSKIVPSTDHPAFIIIADEIADIFGTATPRSELPAGATSNMVLAELGSRIVRKGRSEAVDEVLATQRGTVSMSGSGDLKSQCALRIGLGTATEADARSILPDDTHAARLLARLRHPGTGVISLPGVLKPMACKFFRLDSADPGDREKIERIARRNGNIRPAPDRVAAAALGEAYAKRWENSALLASLKQAHNPPRPSPRRCPGGRRHGHGHDRAAADRRGVPGDRVAAPRPGGRQGRHACGPAADVRADG